MARAARAVDGITFVDLYRDYPRFDIDVDVDVDGGNVNVVTETVVVDADEE